MDKLDVTRLRGVAEGKFHLTVEEVKELASQLLELKMTYQSFTCGQQRLGHFLQSVLATLSGCR